MRLLYLVSHPIQYQAPLLRLIAAEPDIQLRVLFERIDQSGSFHDPGFDVEITWDGDLLSGYEHHHVTSERAMERHLLDADVLWVHGWDSSLKRRALDLARRCAVPVLMRGENTMAAMPDGWGPRGILKRLYLSRIFLRCAGYLCVGSDNREYYRIHGVADAQLHHMPYAVDNEAFARSDEDLQNRLRLELGLEPDRLVVLFAGKLLRRKNPVLLLEAMQRINHEAAGCPYLLFVGDGEEAGRLRKLAHGLDWVKFLGFQNQGALPSIYALSDVFVLPSQREPWGLAVNEAMAAGTAVISTDECGCSADLVDDSVGRVIPAYDGPALVAALEDILSDRSACRELGEAAKRRIASWSFAEDVAGLRSALQAVGGAPPRA